MENQTDTLTLEQVHAAYVAEYGPLTQEALDRSVSRSRHHGWALIDSECKRIAKFVRRERKGGRIGWLAAQRLRLGLVGCRFDGLSMRGYAIYLARFVHDRRLPKDFQILGEAPSREAVVGHMSLADGRIITPGQHYRLRLSDRFKFRPIKSKV